MAPLVGTSPASSSRSCAQRSSATRSTPAGVSRRWTIRRSWPTRSRSIRPAFTWRSACYGPHRRQRGVRGHRYVASPIETRAVSAQVDPYSDELTGWSNTQTPHRVREAIAHTLGLGPERVRVIATDVGGGFGQKGILYVEDPLVPYAARVGPPRALARGPQREPHGLLARPRADPPRFRAGCPVLQGRGECPLPAERGRDSRIAVRAMRRPGSDGVASASRQPSRSLAWSLARVMVIEGVGGQGTR